MQCASAKSLFAAGLLHLRLQIRLQADLVHQTQLGLDDVDVLFLVVEDGGAALSKAFLATQSADSGLASSTQLVYTMRDMHPCRRSCKRVPALLLTLKDVVAN